MLTHTVAVFAVELPLWFRIAISWGMIRYVYPQYFTTIVFLATGIWCARKEIAKARGLETIIALGPVFFAAPIAGFGASHLGFGSVIANMVPSFIPWHVFWIYFVGLCLIAAALSIIARRQVFWSGTLLGILFLGFEITMHVPNVLVHSHDRVIWAIAFRDFSFGGAAWALAGAYASEGRTRTHILTTVGRIIIAGGAVFFAVEHFLHPEFAPGVPLSKITPIWVPGRILLSYVTGTFLLIGGIFLLLGKKTRWAAASTGAMVLVGVLLVYLPLMLTIPLDIVNGFNYFADTLLYGGALLTLAYALPQNNRSAAPVREQVPNDTPAIASGPLRT